MIAKTLLKYAKYVGLGLIVVLIGAKIRAYFFLPEVELPVITYKEIVVIPNSPNEVSQNLFHSQISDLTVNGYQTITPARLRAYKSWGVSLPSNPIIITIESINRDTINYAASILKSYDFCATICIPKEQLNELNKGTNSSLITKEELLTFKEAEIYSYGLKLSSTHYKLASEIKPEVRLMKDIFGQSPEAIAFPNNTDEEVVKNLCSVAGAKLGFYPEADSLNIIYSKTNLKLLKQQKIIGDRLTFSITAIRHPGALAAAEIHIAQPVGERFKACVSVFDKDYNRLLGERFDKLPIEPILLGELPNKVEYPISVYITDETGVVLYKQEKFNRYTIERGEPVPLEKEVPEELEKALSEIEIPLDVE